ncbi:hypothetical protein [Chryseobacterium taichungense]|uniref:hypothetical protein n=1 Tax=Chryseobacterium taichungense TaxID=295069 RepID=UPI0028AA3D60|nr:hypothetical protein [Chryseobacterium taichungense]
MKDKKLFSKKIVYVISLMFTIFSAILYLMAIVVRINNEINFLGLTLISLILILSLFQSYFLIVKNRKGVLLTNIHLVLLLCFMVFELITYLIAYRIYDQDTNGIVMGILFILASIFIVNKFKVSKVEYEDVEKIGTQND